MSALMEKGICFTWIELINKLTSLGFVINDNKMRWGEAPSNTQCYWTIDETNQAINFHTSGEVFPNEENAIAKKIAFHEPLVHMKAIDNPPEGDSDYNDRTNAGFVFIKILGGGCMLYLTPIYYDDTTTLYLYPSCYIDNAQMFSSNKKIKNNGIVVCTPEEEDGYWRYSWRHDAAYPTTEMPDGLYPFDSNNGGNRGKNNFFRWCIDNTHGNVSVGTDLPVASFLPAEMCLSFSKIYFSNGYWSNNIYNILVGSVEYGSGPTIFKINNQKYMIISDNGAWRCPVFKLPIEQIQQNPPTSTEAYSEYKMYAIGDYCIYDGLLYRCIREIRQVGPFDGAYWTVTTVYDEKYGNV